MYFNVFFAVPAQNFPNDKEDFLLEVVRDDQMSSEDIASDILRNYYGTLSQYLLHPIKVAQHLCEVEVISDTTLAYIEDSGQLHSERTVLLKAIRHAVHANHHSLEVFASVLKRFTENVPLGDAIFNDYG